MLIAFVISTSLAACTVIRIEHREITPSQQATFVESPIKAHLIDGSTVIYPTGAWIDWYAIRGEGTRYDLRLRNMGNVEVVLIDSVAGIENYRRGVNTAASVGLSLLTTAAVVAATPLLLIAIFGSCPTIYSDSAGVPVLEAESFSYSIAPLFETRDVDRLGAQPDSAGGLRLEVRNEALETHYINHVELVEVRHGPDELVVPDAGGRPLALRSLWPAERAVDRSGRDVSRVVAAADSEVYESDPRLLETASREDLRDHLDLAFPAPAGVDSAALILRVRNSLLTTVLLYDVMLGSQGAGALDWLGASMERVGSVLELGQWYNRHMGLRILVWEDGEYRPAGRIADTGPVAWKDVGAVVPVPPGDSLRIRLSFVIDSWRIDRVALAAEVRRPDARTIAPARVTNVHGEPEAEALMHLRNPDELYLQTNPGQLFTLHFDTGSMAGGDARTYLIASQGYYTEWIRPSWIRAAANPQPFQPTDDAVLAAIERWRTQRGPLEERFFETRIPVR